MGRLGDAGPSFAARGRGLFATGTVDLPDAGSTLHCRDRIEYGRRGSRVSVDTGKHSIAPWLARRVADDLLGA